MPLQKSLGAGSSQQLFMYLYMCVFYIWHAKIRSNTFLTGNLKSFCLHLGAIT